MRVALRKESVDRNPVSADRQAVRDQSLSARRAWIEMSDLKGNFITNESLSARRAWIEIARLPLLFASGQVALRKESVDRNLLTSGDVTAPSVALRKESVDRNWIWRSTKISVPSVALRKESVDRNASTCFWRPWQWVALRKESVDRNQQRRNGC